MPAVALMAAAQPCGATGATAQVIGGLCSDFRRCKWSGFHQPLGLDWCLFPVKNSCGWGTRHDKVCRFVLQRYLKSSLNIENENLAYMGLVLAGWFHATWLTQIYWRDCGCHCFYILCNTSQQPWWHICGHKALFSTFRSHRDFFFKGQVILEWR